MDRVAGQTEERVVTTGDEQEAGGRAVSKALGVVETAETGAAFP